MPEYPTITVQALIENAIDEAHEAGDAARARMNIESRARADEREKIACWIRERAEEYPLSCWPEIDLSDEPPSEARQMAERNAMSMARHLAESWARRIEEMAK